MAQNYEVLPMKSCNICINKDTLNFVANYKCTSKQWNNAKVNQPKCLKDLRRTSWQNILEH